MKLGKAGEAFFVERTTENVRKKKISPTYETKTPLTQENLFKLQVSESTPPSIFQDTPLNSDNKGGSNQSSEK